MPDTSKMSPEEYAAFTTGMSFPVGVAKLKSAAEDVRAHKASMQCYVDRFIRHLEDPAFRLVTEKPGDWTHWGEEGKTAILAVVREGVSAIKLRAATAEASAVADMLGAGKDLADPVEVLAVVAPEAEVDRPREAAKKACEEPGCTAAAEINGFCQRHWPF